MSHGDHSTSGCRIREFARWDRVMLEHERAHLSKTMASAGAFIDHDGIMHDLADIDYLLANLHVEKT